jgi:hypothetical protein
VTKEKLGISLNAMIESHNPRTMRVKVIINNELIITLVYTGSTYNYICPRVARKVKINFKKHGPIEAKIVDETKI